MRRTLLMLSLLALAAPLAARAECMRAGEADGIAEGRLEQRGDALILKLPEPMCLAGDEASDNVEASPEIHVYAPDADMEASLRALVGKDVLVRGAMMGAITQHHKAPIVMQVSEADEI